MLNPVGNSVRMLAVNVVVVNENRNERVCSRITEPVHKGVLSLPPSASTPLLALNPSHNLLIVEVHTVTDRQGRFTDATEMRKPE